MKTKYTLSFLVVVIAVVCLLAMPENNTQSSKKPAQETEQSTGAFSNLGK